MLAESDELSDLDKKFFEFHRNNPWVCEELVALARKAKAAGRTKIGIKMLWEVIRWNRFISTVGDDYKLNNNYHSRYARYVMSTNPDLIGIFNLRTLST